MQHRLTLRPAVISDADMIEELQERSLLKLGRKYYDRRQIRSFLRFVGTFDSQLIEDATYCVAEAGGVIVGCGGWSFRAAGTARHRGAGPAPRLDPARHPAFIRAIFVDPDRARCGIGTMLMAWAESGAAAAGFERVHLMASLSGEPLYLKLGYRRLGDTELELPDGTHLPFVQMGKAIPSARSDPGGLRKEA